MSSGERKPVAPFYAVGALWLLCGLLLPLYSITHYLLLASISAVAFLAVNAICKSSGVVEAEREKPKPEPAPASQSSANPELDKMLRDGLEAVAEMKRLNDSIAAPGISADISRLEQVSGRIFQAVREDPAKLPQIRRFMDYYLPTTLKLLNAYDRMSAAGVSGENIDASLSKIEAMMHTVVRAFEKQLDSLYGSDALDISTDISVLESMMEREGLTGQELRPDARQQDPNDIRLEF